MTAIPADAGGWQGRALGRRTASYDERDAILYALAVGARPDELDLVYERRLRVLPTFALTLAQWAPDALGGLGAFDVRTAVHGAQRLQVRGPLAPAGELEMSARVAQVWDKGAAAVFEVEVDSPAFLATWSLFAPGCGGFGGERGPERPAPPQQEPAQRLEQHPAANAAVLYRLLGDRHAMHVDPAAAQAAGQPRPFLHGLCTLAGSVLALARATGACPAELTQLEGRFSAPVFPGEALQVAAWPEPEQTRFAVTSDAGPVLSGGRVCFGR